MTSGALLMGLLWLAGFVLPVVATAGRLTRRLLPGAARDVQALAAVVTGAVVLTVPAELLGAVDQLGRLPLLLTYWGLGLLARAVRSGPPSATSPAPRERPTLCHVACALVIGLLVAAWYSRTRLSYATGTLGYDSLTYHLPFAAEMATSHSTAHVPEVLWFLPNNSYPATGNLVHALGMVATGRDVLSPFVSLLWLAVVLLAAAVAFEDRTSRLLSVTAAATVLLLPAFLTATAGTALVDLPCAAFVLAGLALLRRLPDSGGRSLVVGLALGLAVGTKLTAAVPAFVVLLGLLALSSRRGRTAALYVGGALMAGGFWFVRNWVQLGTPLPALHLPLLPAPAHLYEFQEYGKPLGTSIYQPRSVLHYAGSPDDLHVIGRALHLSFGGPWPLLLGGAVLVALVALLRLRGADRLAAAVVVVGAVGYVVTPESAPSFLGHPQLYSVLVETKILLPLLLAAGLVLVALARHRHSLVAIVLTVVAALQVFDPSFYPEGGWRHWSYPTSSRLLALVVAVLVLRMRRVPRAPLLLLVIALAFAGLGSWRTGRYPGADVTAGLGDRLVVAAPGNQVATYPFWRADLSNRVVVFGHRGPHGELSAPRSCTELLSDLARIHPDLVVLTTTPNPSTPPLQSWLEREPRAALVRTSGPLVVYRLAGRPDPAHC